ncbi:MAG TPA: DUF4166 domain-containing protein [Chromatiaceae bacterium]|nr:DUF4166 domain-containing protein [Chromatiaceae bacterium]
MNRQPLMQRALGADWDRLAPALRKHYQHGDNTDTGKLDIAYPRFMQPCLSILRLFGALVDRRGERIPTSVAKRMEGDTQYWRRSIRFPDGRVVLFKSRWQYAGDSELIEYVNAFLGLRMRVRVKAGGLYYEGRHYVLKLGRMLLPIPEWLVLGHTTIEEKALDDERFRMDFRLRHPWFGQVFRYAGEFRVGGEGG